MSARDLAKFGQLFLDGGLSRNRLVPADWVSESTRSYSDTGRTGLLGGYGYMWWVARGGNLSGGTYTAAGNGGRYVVIMPAFETVIAIQPDEKQGQPPVPLYSDKTALDRLVGLLIKAAQKN